MAQGKKWCCPEIEEYLLNHSNRHPLTICIGVPNGELHPLKMIAGVLEDITTLIRLNIIKRIVKISKLLPLIKRFTI